MRDNPINKCTFYPLGIYVELARYMSDPKKLITIVRAAEKYRGGNDTYQENSTAVTVTTCPPQRNDDFNVSQSTIAKNVPMFNGFVWFLMDEVKNLEQHQEFVNDSPETYIMRLREIIETIFICESTVLIIIYNEHEIITGITTDMMMNYFSGLSYLVQRMCVVYTLIQLGSVPQSTPTCNV